MRMRMPRGEGRGASLSRTLWRNLDSLPSPQQVDRLIAREIARAERNGLHFSLALFRVRKGGRVGPTERRLALTLLRRARLTDEVGWFGDEFLCALLPDTSAAGAQIFADSVCDLVARKGPRPIAVVYSYPFDWLDHEDDEGDQGEGARPALAVDRRTGREPPPQDHDHHNGHGRQNGHNGHDRGGPLHLAQAGHDHAPGPVKRGDLMPYLMDGLTAGLDEGGPARAVSVEAPGPCVAEPGPRLVTAAAPDRPAPQRPAADAADAAAPRPPVQPLEELLVRPMPWWKRATDVLGAVAGLAVLSPVLLGSAVAIKLTSPGPVVFKQKRAGLGGRPFTIYKFRTMCADAEAKKKALRALSEQDGPAFKLARDPRVTRVGHFLRKTSIDELPQLINVLKGDMSLVGPRPLPVDEQDACERWQRRRLDVTPGLTCIWQVKGRSQVTFAEWVRMDVAYMRRRTVFHDLSILLRTIPAVLFRRGAR